ncbi:ABC transporter ATP-binding protein [Corynebacterium liangguodongii]|uniref:ABC transporter ATP-binding protein n=1 Tax=Corynebacterium liangguodongii TaxID=2079535 RepID=A0A2S0WCI9_9CORY|nr:ABC transporter ATP-binding protein [Corynebacterium liangguodongii]AWB83483.1 ABC transporter ATP-binding protein [Corynebacterium liangguodongii]PWC00428.1 ABC transporter ATP-binding protein [Corynebacterium liangguodongii]
MTSPHSPGIYGLIGPSAAGKTHYLRSLFGPGAAFVPAAADALFAGRTAGDHLAWAGEAKPLAPVELSFAERTHIAALSVGQRRELTFLVALAAGEPLLLLDEPFDGLDVSTRTRLREHLIDYIAADPERTVVMSSHRAEDLAGLAERVIRVFDRTVEGPVSLDAVRAKFPILTGPREAVEAFTAHRTVVSTSHLGPTLRAQLAEPLNVDPGGAGAGVEVAYPHDAQLIDLLASRKDILS